MNVTIDHISTFMQGAICLCSLLSALFFWRFYTTSKDRLFAYFAGSFLLMALIRVFLSFSPEEVKTGMYWLRFCSFLLIIFAIIDKNRPASK